MKSSSGCTYSLLVGGQYFFPLLPPPAQLLDLFFHVIGKCGIKLSRSLVNYVLLSFLVGIVPHPLFDCMPVTNGIDVARGTRDN